MSADGIHPTAVVDPKAIVAPSAKVGAFSVIGPEVTIAADAEIGHHCVLEGRVEIGERARIGHGTVLGGRPQDLKFKGEETFLTIGSHNVFREYVNINRGTKGGGGHTKIGDHNFLMVYAHVAHDCILGNHIIMANAATLAGHVLIEDHATIGAFSGVHQFCRIGTHGYVGGYSVITKDVLPFSKTVSERNTKAYGPNVLGLERKGFTPQQIKHIKKAFRLLQQSKLNTSQAVEAIKSQVNSPEVQIILDFIDKSDRGVIK